MILENTKLGSNFGIKVGGWKFQDSLNHCNIRVSNFCQFLEESPRVYLDGWSLERLLERGYF